MFNPGNTDISSERQILRSAIELFATKGCERTSIRDICELSGLSRPVLYYYFGSKEGLINAVLTSVCCRLQILISSALATEDTFRKQCHTLVRILLQDASENPLSWRLVLAQASGPQANNSVTQLFHDFNTLFLKSVRAAIQRGELSDFHANIPGAIISGAIILIVAKHVHTGMPQLSSTLSIAIVEAIFQGLSRKMNERTVTTED